MLTPFKSLSTLAVTVMLVISVIACLLYSRAAHELQSKNVALAEYAVQLEGANKALAVAAAQRKVDAALLARRQKENASTASKLALAQRGLQEALEANKTWASTFVPPAVRSSILSDSEQAEAAAKALK